MKHLLTKFMQFIRDFFTNHKEHHMTYVPSPTLILRPRRASNTRRRTQVQLPLPLVHSEFFDGVFSIRSASGKWRKLVNAHARGKLNTVKVEIPEIEKMEQPVLRLTKLENGDVVYAVFDAAYSFTGQTILDTLRAGIGNNTKTTVRDAERATWYQRVA